MLPGLSALEVGRVRMSVGYGMHKKGRPLSPIEVGSLLQQAREHGLSVQECAQAAHIDATGVGRFLRILKLPEDLQHLVDWGTGANAIGFSSAVDLVRLGEDDDQRAVAKSILTDRLRSKEVRQVVQLRARSGRAIRDCINEIVGMRPTIAKRYVFIGSLGEGSLADALAGLTQIERDSLLQLAIQDLQLEGATGRMGKRFFTLVGNQLFETSMNSIGKENIETQLRTRLAEHI